MMVAIACCLGSCGESGPSDRQPDAVYAPNEISPLRVRQGALMDAHGRSWHLRGINARIEGLFDVTFDDGRERLQPLPGWKDDDAQRMVEAGFSFLRLPINWSGVEPERGTYNEAYLAQIERVLEDARAAGLYVLIDWHQDAWSKHIGEDGAPLWAIVPPPDALLEGPLTSSELDERRVSAQVMRAFRSFFENAEGIQDAFLDAWQHVASLFADRVEVIGFEPMNEPVAGHFPGGRRMLQEFYERSAQRLRREHPDVPIWLEPEVTERNFTLQATHRTEPFPDAHVVYTPHLYPGLAGRNATTVLGWISTLNRTFEEMAKEAASYGDVPVVIGEWGADPRRESGTIYATAFLSLVTRFGYGSALWLWKEESQGFWGLHDRDPNTGRWVPRTDAFVTFSPPHVQAVPGHFVEMSWDPESRVFEATFEARGGETAGPLLYLPRSWYPEGIDLTLDGEPIAMESLEDVGGRKLMPWSSDRSGRHVLRMAPVRQ